jgi:hypothetical protein
MSGLMRRLTRGRAATDDEATPQASAASEPVSATPDAQQGGLGLPANGATAPGDGARTGVGDEAKTGTGDEPKTAVLVDGGGPATTGETKVAGDEARDLPAGVDPATLAAVPSSARRGRLRRRLRYLRAVREILLRDIGGFYYEAQRSDEGVEPHRRLLDAKAGRLARLDEEVRELESRLAETRPETLLRQPGLGGTCPQCGELHGSDARFCWRCGTQLGGRAARTRLTAARAAPAVAPASDEGTKATTASLWGRPKRSEPPVVAPAPDAGPAFAAPGGPAKPAPPSAGEVDPVRTDDGDATAAETGDGDATAAKAGNEEATAAKTGDDEAAPTGSERS